MNPPRHAASAAVIPAVFVALAGMLAAAIGVLVTAAFRIARKVVTPAPRVADVEVRRLDTSAQTVTLTRTPDSVLPGRYGLFTNGTHDYLKLGSVLSEDERTVTRKLLTHIGSGAKVGRWAAFSGWYFDSPAQLHIPFREVEVAAPVGPSPAWLFPAGSGDVWAIAVHGRGTMRAETLRAVPVLHDAGVTTIVVSYRNDGEAPASSTGTYALGAREWKDVEAAIEYALSQGARRIVLMGWSMGGAIVLQTALNTAHPDAIAGVILESPVVDWRLVLGYQARMMGVPRPLTRVVLSSLSAGWGGRVVRGGAPIPFDRLDVVSRAAELRHPILLLHSDDDGFVPSDASHALAAARTDLVTMHTFRIARHTKLWNYDETRWNGAIGEWLDQQGLRS